MRAEIERNILGKAEAGPATGAGQPDPRRIAGWRMVHGDEPLAVLARPIWRFPLSPRDVMIDGGNARGVGMPPGCRLHAREPRESEKIRQGVGGDVGIEQ